MEREPENGGYAAVGVENGRQFVGTRGWRGVEHTQQYTRGVMDTLPASVGVYTNKYTKNGKIFTAAAYVRMEENVIFYYSKQIKNILERNPKLKLAPCFTCATS